MDKIHVFLLALLTLAMAGCGGRVVPSPQSSSENTIPSSTPPLITAPTSVPTPEPTEWLRPTPGPEPHLAEAMEFPEIAAFSLVGHTEEIGFVTLTPDDKRAVTISYDGTLKVWDLENGNALLTMCAVQGYTCDFEFVSLAPDASRVAVRRRLEAGYEFMILDLSTGAELSSFAAPDYGKDLQIAFAPDGARFVTYSPSLVDVKIWRVGDGQELLTLHPQRDGISALGITPDSNQIILAPWRSEGENGELELWDLESGELLRTLTGHTDLVFEIKVIGESQHVLSVALDGTVRVWDLTTGTELYIIEAQFSPFFGGIELSPEGTRAILQTIDLDLGEVEFQVWDLSRGEKLATLGTDDVQVVVGGEETVEVKINPTWAIPINEETAVGAMSDYSFVVWDLDTGEVLREDEYEAPNTLAVTSDGRRAVAAKRGRPEIWDLESGKVLSSLYSAHTEPVTCMALMPSGRNLLSGSEDGTIRVWDIETGTELPRLDFGFKIEPPINAIARSPDGGRVVAVADWLISIWDLRSGKEIMTIERMERDDLTSVEITPDGEHFIVGSDAGVVSIFNMGTGRVEKSFTSLPGISNITMLPDGKRLVVTSGASVSFYDLETGELLSQVQGKIPTGSVLVTYGGIIANDGTKMAYATFDYATEAGTIHIVDLTTGSEVLTLEGHKNWITSLALIPDGSILLSGSLDNTVRLWDLETGEELFLRAEERGGAKVIVVTSDGQRALILSNLDILKVWDLSSWVDDLTGGLD